MLPSFSHFWLFWTPSPVSSTSIACYTCDTTATAWLFWKKDKAIRKILNVTIKKKKNAIPWDISARAALKRTAEFSMDPAVWLLLRMVYYISAEIALSLCAVLELEKTWCHSNRFCHEVRCDTTVPSFSTPVVCLTGQGPSASGACEATSLLSCPSSPSLGCCINGDSTGNNASFSCIWRTLLFLFWRLLSLSSLVTLSLSGWLFYLASKV